MPKLVQKKKKMPKLVRSSYARHFTFTFELMHLKMKIEKRLSGIEQEKQSAWFTDKVHSRISVNLLS